jgi:hypothetical protein
MTETPEPQPVQFETQAANGGSHDYGADWITYALNTEAPPFVGGVDYALNPAQPASPDGGEAYA